MPLMKGGVTRKFELAPNSLKYDELSVGSQRYTGNFNSCSVAFNILEDRICIEFLDNQGNVIETETYNTKAELVK